MNSEEIERILRRHVVDFDGVFSVDTLSDKSRLLVYNTEPSKKPGQRWVCICVKDGGRGEFFDSFGHRSTTVFERYLNRHCSSWNLNDKQLQSVVSNFSSDTGLNDVLVHGFVYRQQ